MPCPILPRFNRERIIPRDDFSALSCAYARRAVFYSLHGRTVPEAREQEIASEQRVVDRVYERVDAMRARARVLVREGHARATAGPPASLVERDALVLHAAEQLRALDAEAEGLVFGR